MAHLNLTEAMNAIIRATAYAAKLLGLKDGSLKHIDTNQHTNGALCANLVDTELRQRLIDLASPAGVADWSLKVEFQKECFDDAKMPMDSLIGVSENDPLAEKAAARCADIIAGAYRTWRKNHEPVDMREVLKIAHEALVKLSIWLHLEFRFYGSRQEVAEKYASFLCTEKHIPDDPNQPLSNRYFQVEFKLSDYYAKVGEHNMDARIGIEKLKRLPKRSVCLLRIAKNLQGKFILFIFENWPNIYDDYTSGKFKGGN